MTRRHLSVLSLVCGLAWALGTGSALGWNCPVHIRAAEDAIKRAEAMKLTPEAKALVEDAKRFLAESKKHHADARGKIDHANSMWKAKAALAEAESAAAISTP